MTEKYSSAQILASSPVGMALMRDTRCVFLNDAFAAAVGHPREALLSADLFTLVAPEDEPQVRERHVARRKGDTVPAKYEINVLGADGARRRVELEPRVLGDSDMLLTVRPLTEAVRGRDLIIALGELQSRAQRERTVQGVMNVSLNGLCALGAGAGLVRMIDGVIRLECLAIPDDLAELMRPLVEFWKNTPGVPAERAPRLRQVIADQRPLWMDDLAPLLRDHLQQQLAWSPEQVNAVLRHLSQHQMVITPLRVREQPYGAVMATGVGLRSPDLAALSLFAQQLGAMIEVAESIEALERQNRILESIHRVATVRTDVSVEALVLELLRLLTPATDSDEAAIFLIDQDGQWLTLAGTTTPGRPFAERYRRLPVQRTATGQAVLFNEPRAFTVDEWPAASREDVRAEGYLHLAVMPLKLDGRVAGVLNLTRRRDQRYDVGQLRDAEMLLTQVALQIERARMHEEARQRVEDLSLVNEVGARIAQELQLDSVMAVAMSHASRLVSVQNCFVFLLDEADDNLRMVATSVPGDPLDIVIPRHQPSAASDTVNLRRPVVIEDALADPCASKPPADRYGHKSLLAVPLLSGGKPIGAIVLGDTKQMRGFTANEIDRAVAVANQVASAIVNARLFESVKDSYQRLSAAQAELVKRERLAALGELSAVVAHEVRNPLAVIFNSLAGMRRVGPLDGEAGQLLAIVNEEAERLNRMVSDLLDFARPHEAMKRSERLEPLLQDALETATRVFPGSRVKLSLAVMPELGVVPVDPHQLRQAVVNLLVNALQAMPEGGQVSVRAARDERNGRTMARIDVSDTGPGISPELAERIFTPFFTTRASGTGLGLAVVKRIADAHRAELAVQSQPGRGATFSLWLPL